MDQQKLEARAARISSENTAIAMLVVRYSQYVTSDLIGALVEISGWVKRHSEASAVSAVDLNFAAIEHVLLARGYGRDLLPAEYR